MPSSLSENSATALHSRSSHSQTRRRRNIHWPCLRLPCISEVRGLYQSANCRPKQNPYPFVPCFVTPLKTFVTSFTSSESNIPYSAWSSSRTLRTLYVWSARTKYTLPRGFSSALSSVPLQNSWTLRSRWSTRESAFWKFCSFQSSPFYTESKSQRGRSHPRYILLSSHGNLHRILLLDENLQSLFCSAFLAHKTCSSS